MLWDLIISGNETKTILSIEFEILRPVQNHIVVAIVVILCLFVTIALAI